MNLSAVVPFFRDHFETHSKSSLKKGCSLTRVALQNRDNSFRGWNSFSPYADYPNISSRIYLLLIDWLIIKCTITISLTNCHWYNWCGAQEGKKWQVAANRVTKLVPSRATSMPIISLPGKWQHSCMQGQSPLEVLPGGYPSIWSTEVALSAFTSRLVYTGLVHTRFYMCAQYTFSMNRVGIHQVAHVCAILTWYTQGCHTPGLATCVTSCTRVLSLIWVLYTRNAHTVHSTFTTDLDSVRLHQVCAIFGPV